MTEGLWKAIKHNDLEDFNRPRLDLVTHIITNRLIPRIRYNLEGVRKHRRKGQGSELTEWQKDFKREWGKLSKPDERRNIERELEWLYKPQKTKGRAERLAQIRENSARVPGKYHTNAFK